MLASRHTKSIVNRMEENPKASEAARQLKAYKLMLRVGGYRNVPVDRQCMRYATLSPVRWPNASCESEFFFGPKIRRVFDGFRAHSSPRSIENSKLTRICRWRICGDVTAM
jgi:hypothetical protein